MLLTHYPTRLRSSNPCPKGCCRFIRSPKNRSSSSPEQLREAHSNLLVQPIRPRTPRDPAPAASLVAARCESACLGRGLRKGRLRLIAGTAKDKMRSLVQRTILGSSKTENPVESAALPNRWSPQMKLLLDGRCSHQIRDAASCRLSAARKECLSNNCVARLRTWSSGRISLHPRLSKLRRATAPCLSRSVIS